MLDFLGSIGFLIVAAFTGWIINSMAGRIKDYESERKKAIWFFVIVMAIIVIAALAAGARPFTGVR